MTDNKSEAIAQVGQTFFKTYWFWGLVLVAFLLRFSEFANSTLMFSWTEHGVSFGAFTIFIHLGMLVAGLLSVYFLRIRLKKSLVIFTLVYLLSLILLRLAPTTQSGLFLAATFFINIGYFGIILTILAVLVTAKLPLKSFLIAILIMWLGKSIAEYLGGLLDFRHSNLENQILGFYLDASDGALEPSVQDMIFYYSTRLLPAALAVFAAAQLSSKKLFGQTNLKSETRPTLPTKGQPSGWLWQDLVSTYRFWGLVLVSFFIGIAKNAIGIGNSDPASFVNQFGQNLYIFISISPPFIAGLLTLFFVKDRIKAPLIGFSLLFLISLSLVNFGIIPDPVMDLALRTFKDIGYYGVILTVLSALVTAKLPLKSFLIAFFIIWFWSYLGDFLGFAYGHIELGISASFLLKIIVPVLPAAFAVLAATSLKPKMFFSAPDVMVEAKPAKPRQPVEVFFYALIVPFYFLYWLFKQPGELKTIAPDMHQPSPGGALCLGLFAPLILPMWFHDVRKGLGPTLKARSARRIAAASFFMPAIAAGMAQSDYNQIANEDSDST